MVAQVNGAFLYKGFQAETTLDPKEQPFLYDHAMDGVPLLPGVMGTETFAQLAQVFAPDYRVFAVTNERFENPFKFHRMEPQTLYLTAQAFPAANDTIVVHTVMESRRKLVDGNVQIKRHFSAEVVLAKDAPPQRQIDVNLPAELDITPAAIYKIYFHGAAYQVLAGATVNEQYAIGQYAAELPPNTQPVSAEIMLPRLIEFCFQTAGIWEMRTKGRMALPLAIGAVAAYREPAAGVPLYAIAEAVNDGACFNALVVDAEGNVYVELSDYQTVALPVEAKL